MQANVGTIDRALRIVVGLVLISLAATGRVGAWGWIGALPLLTGIVRVCPAYSILGVKTCASRKSCAK
ncbi:YgaP family membrane protein [Cupriavidus basilensis]